MSAAERPGDTAKPTEVKKVPAFRSSKQVDLQPLPEAIAANADLPPLRASQALTLEEALDRALSSDQSVRVAFLEVSRAQLTKWSALTRLTPRLTGTLAYELVQETRFDPTVSSAAPPDSSLNAGVAPRTGFSSANTVAGGSTASPSIPTVQQTEVPLGASEYIGTRSHTRRGSLMLQQTLLDLTVFPAWQFGKLSAQSADLRRLYTIRETLFGVAQAYYQVLKTQGVVGVNRQTVELATKQLTVAESRLKLDEVVRADVFQAQATLEAARRALIESEGLLEIQRNSLSNILNMDWRTNLVLIEPETAPTDIAQFESVLARAYQRREDYRASSLGIDQNIERRKEIGLSYAPQVVAQANHDWTNVTINTPDSSSHRLWTGSVAVQVPIFTGGEREISLRRARYDIELAKLDHEKLSKAIQDEVKRAWVDVRTLRLSLKTLEAEVAAAQRSYHDLQSNYAAGTTTNLDVLTGLRDLNNSRTALTSAQCDYQIALRNLQRAEGVFQQHRVQSAKVK